MTGAGARGPWSEMSSGALKFHRPPSCSAFASRAAPTRHAGGCVAANAGESMRGFNSIHVAAGFA
jgi:hypothetical protein